MKGYSMKLDATSPVVTSLQVLLANKVTEYKQAFAAREAVKEGKPSYKRALSFDLPEEMSDELDGLEDVILSHQNVPVGEGIAIYYAHLSEKLATLSKVYKDFAELNLDSLPQTSQVEPLSEDALFDLKEECDQYFKTLLSLTEDPSLSGQAYSSSGQGGKSYKLDIPRFHRVKETEDSYTLTLKIDGHFFNSIKEACDVTWSVKPSVFLQAWKETGHTFKDASYDEKFDMKADGTFRKVEVIKV